MREVFERDYGVSVRWVEAQSRDTHENALLSAQLLREQNVARVLLVTDGVHMRRAQREFSAAGAHVIAAPTVLPSLVVDNPIQLLPSVHALYKSHDALHEFAGNLLVTLGHTNY